MNKLHKRLSLGVIALTVPLAIGKIYSEGNGPQFMGPEFAAMMCTEWNKSALPKALATEDKGGNGWIELENSYTDEVRHKQVIIMSRRDCSNIGKTQLTIENKDGMAICTYGGKMTEVYEKAEWAFAPETHHWYDFAGDGWGMMAMRKLMNGMRGPMGAAYSNRGNFGTFWKFTGKLAVKVNADYKAGCPSLDKDDVQEIEELIKDIK